VLTVIGPDASPTVLPLRQFGMENQRQLPFLPQDPPIACASEKRLVMSFWEREIHIWRLTKPSESIAGVDELESDQNRKLVAKILIKGEANITSAVLSADGNLLAAATTADVKLFQLKTRKLEDGVGLKVSKILVPRTFSFGARHVKFSPDERWLCIVRPDSRIFLARLLNTSSATVIHPKLSKLSRIDRKVDKHVLLGGLGTYDRTITQVAFSSNSRIIAVSDLAGYIDTFVLSGKEDLTQALPLDIDDAASDSSDSEDSEGEAEDTKVKLILSQSWRRNPSASNLPKLPSALTILSFRPSTEPQTNGVAGHAINTRHNPNPAPQGLPIGEDRLLVTTATGDVFEFEVLKGSLSPWSRRNPTAHFPEDFRKIRDQARGCIWDVSVSKERVWIYGAGWLWMFDLSRDFPHSANPSSKKRKRGIEKASGAGSTIPDEELGTGISRKMERIVHEEVNEIENVPFHDQEMIDADSEDDGEDTAMERLPRRNEEEKQVAKSNEGGSSGGQQWWRTFKYRPILGMCVVGGREDGDIGPEVAIVERPIWEADLGPRYSGDQEWEKGSLNEE
jgi:U3 small nucleolar RNA-associated protein 4